MQLPLVKKCVVCVFALFCTADTQDQCLGFGRVKGLKRRTGVTGAGHMIRRALPLQGLNGMKDLLVAPKISKSNELIV